MPCATFSFHSLQFASSLFLRSTHTSIRCSHDSFLLRRRYLVCLFACFVHICSLSSLAYLLTTTTIAAPNTKCLLYFLSFVDFLVKGKVMLKSNKYVHMHQFNKLYTFFIFKRFKKIFLQSSTHKYSTPIQITRIIYFIRRIQAKRI